MIHIWFFASSDLDLDVTAQVREPKNTRPLNLSNTHNKLTALGIAAPLYKIAPDIVHKAQQGGIQGRQMMNELMNIE